jgi:transposase
MREGNDVLRRQRRQRGREAREEEHATNARSRREVLKILPSSGVALVATTVAIGGFTAQPSFAAGEKLSSVEEKELAKERRKAAVRAAAERAKETGVGGNAFSDSEYMVGEDHSPNAHSHQEEGSKGSFV